MCTRLCEVTISRSQRSVRSGRRARPRRRGRCRGTGARAGREILVHCRTPSTPVSGKSSVTRASCEVMPVLTASAWTVGKTSGMGEWMVQLDDSSKHSQQHSSSRRSMQESPSVFREGKRAASRESRGMSIRGKNFSVSIVSLAVMFLNSNKHRLLCVESPSAEKFSSKDRREVNCESPSILYWKNDVDDRKTLHICAHICMNTRRSPMYAFPYVSYGTHRAQEYIPSI